MKMQSVGFLNTNNSAEIIQEVKSLENPTKAVHMSRFFKTGKGEYAQGDLFLGLTAPEVQVLARKYRDVLSWETLEDLLHCPYHEVRALALTIMVHRYQKYPQQTVLLYLKNISYINNWDLVDISCYKILGCYAYENNDYSTLFSLSQSGHLWSERISVVSCMYAVKKGYFNPLKKLAVFFLPHKHDLMHKAVGWLLREMGKKDADELRLFLNQYAAQMPRTMLRYAIEKFSKEERTFYLNKKSL